MARPGLGYVYAFGVFNALSWSIVQGVPLLLFLKSLDAPATVLGLVMGMTPFFQILQVPAARWVERIGYRSMAVRGWSGRNLAALGLVGVAFSLPFLGATWAIAITALVMFVYNILRGAGGAAFLPWFSQLTAPEERGQFLAREKMGVQAALLVNFALVATVLGHIEDSFAWIFAFGWGMGAVALFFLRRIPDVPVDPLPESHGAVPWRTLWAHRPFALQVTAMGILYLVQGAAGLLWIPVLRDRFHVPDNALATLPMLSVSINLLSMMVLSRVLDRSGSRPVLAVGSSMTCVHLLLWAALSGGLMPYGLSILLAIQFTAGLAFGLIMVSGERLMMANLPGQGRSHFFALSSMVSGLALGLSPIAWGAMVDLLHGWSWGPLNNHSLPYLVAAAVTVVAGVLLQRIPEERPLTTAGFLAELFRTPVRALARWWSG